MDFGPDLTPYEEAMPKAWEDMLKEIEGAGGNINHREAIKARIDVAITADQIMHDQYQADLQRKHENKLEDRREDFQTKMAAQSEAFQSSLEANEKARHAEAMQSAKDDRAAQKAASDAAASTAKALNAATWVLAAATIVLVIVTWASLAK